MHIQPLEIRKAKRTASEPVTSAIASTLSFIVVLPMASTRIACSLVGKELIIVTVA